MDFATRVKKNETKKSPAGSKEANTYQIRIDKDNHKSLVKTGKKDIYTAIQADLESTKIENILRECVYDPTVLQQVNGTYIDVTNMPKTLGEMQNLVLDAKAQFEALPAELRNKFDNSAEKFVNLYGTEEFNKILGLNKEQPSYPTIEAEASNNNNGKENKKNEQ